MRTRWVLLTLGALLVLALMLFPFWWPLFNDTVVDEPFPGVQMLSEEERLVFDVMVEEDPEMAQTLLDAALAEPTIVPEADQTMPDVQGPTVYASGEFTYIDPFHWAEGTATLYQLADGSALLRFEDFEAQNGPDLYVILSSSVGSEEEPMDSAMTFAAPLNGFNLGRLKGNIGSQNYMIPPELDLDQVQSVVIYCQQFDVVFSTAALL